jgi:hypothetical protein
MAVYESPQTLMQLLVETCELLEKYKDDPLVKKEDVIDSMEEKLSLLIGKIITVPTYTSFALFESNQND